MHRQSDLRDNEGITDLSFCVIRSQDLNCFPCCQCSIAGWVEDNFTAISFFGGEVNVSKRQSVDGTFTHFDLK